MRAGLDRGRRAVLRDPAGAEQAGLAEQIDIRQLSPAARPGRAGCDLFRRAPQADDVAQARHPRGEVHFIQPQRQLGRCHQRIAGLSR